MPSSSTSSSSRSRGVPWAGLFALLIALCVDRGLLEHAMPWRWIEARLPAGNRAELGIVRDELALARARRAPRGQPRVLVIGSSRADAGFRPETLAAGALSGVVVAKLAHPGLMPFETLAAIDAALATQPAVAVLVLSELETHHPLELRAFLAYGSARAALDLAIAAGPSFVASNATDFYRLALASLSNAYRYREVFARAGLGAWIRFPLDPPRLGAGRDANQALFERYHPVNPLSETDRQQLEATIRANLTPEGAIWAVFEFVQLRSLARGPHVWVQQQLLRDGIQRLRAAGSGVILVEPPLFPPARILYDPTLRDDFVDFARSLEAAADVTFVPRESQPSFGLDDFHDLTHLNDRGAAKLTRVIADAVRAELRRGHEP